MRLRRFNLDDYEELVDMFYEFNKEVYKGRKIGLKYSHYMVVNEWISKKYDLILSIADNNEICGFSLGYIDDNNRLIEPMYNGEIIYVKENYRTGRAAYKLYTNIYNYSKELKMGIKTLSRVENNSSDMVAKHFDLKDRYILQEGAYNE